MGLKFVHLQESSDPIEIGFRFPDSEPEKQRIWDLWKEKHEELRADGFCVKKMGNEDAIIYTEPRNSETQESITMGSESRKFVELECALKCCKWELYHLP